MPFNRRVKAWGWNLWRHWFYLWRHLWLNRISVPKSKHSILICLKLPSSDHNQLVNHLYWRISLAKIFFPVVRVLLPVDPLSFNWSMFQMASGLSFCMLRENDSLISAMWEKKSKPKPIVWLARIRAFRRFQSILGKGGTSCFFSRWTINQRVILIIQ